MAPGAFRGHFLRLTIPIGLESTSVKIIFAGLAKIPNLKSDATLCRNPGERINGHESAVTNHQLLSPTMPIVQLIQTYLAAERIAVHSEESSGARLIAMKTFQHALDKFLFKFIYRFIEMDTAVHHLAYQRFQLLLHRSTLRTKVVRCQRFPAARLAEFMAR
jgi:hypothetical protein